MSDTLQSNALLIEVLRTQELLKLEFQRMAQLIEIQREEITALRHTNTSLFNSRPDHSEFIEETAGFAAYAIPYGLNPPQKSQDRQRHLTAVHHDIEAAFYPSPHALHMNSAYIRYRQIQGLDLRGKRIAVLTTANVEYSDLLEATRADETVELRLHSITGPFTLAYRTQTGSNNVQIHTGGIESVFFGLDTCDFLWIPDPHLSSLVLRCRGAIERIAERVRENFLLSIRSDQWDENEARLQIHTAGFTEITRLLKSAETPYVTRYHEMRGYYVHVAATLSDDTQVSTQFLVASKIPSASFRITPLTEQ